MKILVISADAEAAAAVSRQLIASVVCIEQSFAVGLERLQAQAFDAMLLDLAVAGDLGGAAFDQAQSLAPALPILLLCDPDSEALGLEALRRGAQDYLLRGHVDQAPLTHLFQCAGARHRAVAALRSSLTAHEVSELALRESEARFKLLFEQAPDALALGDRTGRCLDVNLAFEELTGFPRQTLVGTTFVQLGLIAAPDRPLIREAIQQVAASGAAPPIDLTLIRPDGSRRQVEAHFFPISSGGEALMINSLRDITHRKRAEDNLRESEEHLRLANAELSRAMRLKDEFLSSMSHELRTPLSAVLGLAESLDEGVYGRLEPRQRAAVHDIAQSGQHLLSLINDILDLSRIEADRLSLELQPVLVTEICEASLRLVREQAQQKQLSIGLSIAPGARLVRADPRRLKQIFVNLLSNAVKFTPNSGQIGIEVEVDQPAKLVHFTVWDTGIGIVPEQLGRLFQPFVQLDSELSRQYSGTGLGLVLVRRLAALHGGSVSVQSEPGRGSRFTLTLACAEELPQTLAWPPRQRQRGEPSRPEAPPSGPPRRRILVAEDKRLNQEMVRDYLSRSGYTVYAAWNGLQAVEQAHALLPDLILMDIQMPELDGLEAMRRIRAIPALSQVPIIALTAMAMAGDRERCLAAGASAYLPKPVELKALRALVDALLTAGGAIAVSEG